MGLSDVKTVSVGDVVIGEHDVRAQAEDEQLKELMESISRLGILSPLICRFQDGKYEIIAGHRRFRAAVGIGLKTVPVFVTDYDNQVDRDISFAENMFRRDLSPIELAAAIKDCIVGGTMTVERVAIGLSHSEHWVRQQLAIMTWPTDVQQAVHVGDLSVAAASNLALITDTEYRTYLLRVACENGAKARTTAAWLQAWQTMKPPEIAVQQEAVPGVINPEPLVPQAPCYLCGITVRMDSLMCAYICTECTKQIRQGRS
jgi:ParB family chromosome partitioning protein